METLFLKLVNLSITASWLVLAVLLMRLVFRKAPKWVCCLLWGLVALRLICPISIESALSLIPSAEPLPQDILYTAVPKIQSGVGIIDDFVNPVLSDSMSPELGASVNPTQIWSFVLSRIWAAGAIAMLLYALISYLILRHRVITATLFSENIKQSERVDSPFVLGFFRPVIYLPYSVAGTDMTYVIAHEKAHIHRKDHWWKPVGFILLAVYWFNPLMWAAYVLLCRDIEAACDEKVIREMEKEDRRAYSTALLRCSVRHRMIAACPLAFGETGVKERVKSVMNYKKPAFWILVLAVAACVAVAVCFLTDPVTAVRNPWTQEYVPGTGNILGNVDKEKFESISEDFAIGADRYGRAVFKDPYKAFDTFVFLYAEGIALIQEQNDLTPISRNNYDLYKVYGWQTTSGSEEAQTQAGFVSHFLDIYENSFTKETPKANTKTTIVGSEPTLWKWQAGSILLTPGTSYVSWQCLYMNPFSSYSTISDSGYRYVIGEDSFSVISLLWGSDVSGGFAGIEIGSTDVSRVYAGREIEGTEVSDSSMGEEMDNGGRHLAEKVRVSKWEWQEFPYTGAEWEALFKPESSAAISDIHSLYGEILYQPLNDQKFLLLADGDLLIVELHENAQMGKHIWSIYSLINETNMGVAQWEYVPELSSRLPAFRFVFDMEYTEISAICTNGKLVDFDSQSVSQAAHSDTALTLLKGNALYWSPVKESDGIWQASDSAIYFYCTRENGSQFSGTIYIAAGGSSNGRTIYTATLVGTGLHLSPNVETEGGVISLLATDAEFAVTKYDLQDGELELSSTELSQYVFYTNSQKIAVTVKCDDDFEGTVILRDISQNNAEIMRKDISRKDRKVVFTSLTSARLYRIEYDGMENCTIVVSPK